MKYDSQTDSFLCVMALTMLSWEMHDSEGSDLACYLPAAAAKSIQPCLTLCDLIDGLLPGSSVSGILQARTLEWFAIYLLVRKESVKQEVLCVLILLNHPH